MHAIRVVALRLALLICLAVNNFTRRKLGSVIGTAKGSAVSTEEQELLVIALSS
jgi:hypothetical protein